MADITDLDVKGFSSNGCRDEKYGLALIVADEPVACSVMVTSNKIRAAPLDISVENSRERKARALVVSSGNANAFTGIKGLKDATRMTEVVADYIGCDSSEVLVNSTGIIGQNLDMECIEGLIKSTFEGIDSSSNGLFNASEAMKTTDAFNKISSKDVSVDNKKVRITGVAKGAGMISPDLMHATMIAVILTDAHVPTEMIDTVLKEAVKNSFNMINVDGDVSTNDMVVLLSSGKANNQAVDEAFQEALNNVCIDLAKMIVKDGEGAGKFMEVFVKGAGSESDARKTAKAVVNSTLVKTALFGENPNWGRVIAAVGYSGADFDKERLSLAVKNSSLEAVLVNRGVGVALKKSNEIQTARKIFEGEELTFIIDLGIGKHSATAYGCDLGPNYVKVNAEYTT